MIDPKKLYRTRDGREVRIYAVDGSPPYPVHGAVRDADGWCHEEWSDDGQWDRLNQRVNNNTDLIEVKPRIKRKVWVNVYPEDSGMPDAMYLARANAEHCAFSDRIACVEIDIDVEEGHGL